MKPKPITPRDERFYDSGKEAGRREVLELVEETLLSYANEVTQLPSYHAGSRDGAKVSFAKTIASRIGIKLDL